MKIIFETGWAAGKRGAKRPLLVLAGIINRLLTSLITAGVGVSQGICDWDDCSVTGTQPALVGWRSGRKGWNQRERKGTSNKSSTSWLIRIQKQVTDWTAENSLHQKKQMNRDIHPGTGVHNCLLFAHESKPSLSYPGVNLFCSYSTIWYSTTCLQVATSPGPI